METIEQKTARNRRVQARYDQLMTEGKHGHYETMFRVVREEVEQQLAECEKQIAMMHEQTKAIQGHMNLYWLFSCEGSDSYDPECAEKNLDKVNEYAKALAATQDLSGLVLCDAKPTAYMFPDKTCMTADIPNSDVVAKKLGGTPLYKARKQP
jgi:hypothetical protein